jgi:hypothetical protein
MISALRAARRSAADGARAYAASSSTPKVRGAGSAQGARAGSVSTSSPLLWLSSRPC